MLISCEKCATTYELDAKLIPAAGAPVRCTRCGHVFTARPEAPRSDPGAVTVLVDSTDPVVVTPPHAVAAAPRQAAKVEPPRPTFSGSAAPPGLAPRHPAVAPSRPPEPASRAVARPYSAADAERVLSRFDGGLEGAGAESDGSTESRHSRTQLFALSDIKPPQPQGPAAPIEVLAEAAAPEPQSARRSGTALFSMSEFGQNPNAPADEADAPASPADARQAKTQLFALADLEREIAAATPAPTVITQAPEPAPASAPAAPARRSGTVLFALSDLEKPPDSPTAPDSVTQPRMTQVFGLEPVSAPLVPPQRVAAQPAPIPAGTQAYGSTSGAPQRAQTQMFGPPGQPAAAPAAPPAQPPRSQTQMFGPAAVLAAPPAQPQRSQTQMFGPAGQIAPAPPPAQPQHSQTMMFGPPAAQPAPVQQAPQPLRAQTMIFGPAAQAPPTAAPAAPQRSATLMFGPPDPLVQPTPPALQPRAAPQLVGAPVDPSMFATPSAGVPAFPEAAPASYVPAPSMRSTQMFGLTDAGALQPQAPAAPVPLPMAAPKAVQVSSPQPLAAQDDPEAMFRAQLKRRNRRAIVFGVVLVLGAAGFGAYKYVGSRRPAVPPAVLAERDEAMMLLRRDDAASKKEAASRLAALSQKNPQFVEPRAALLLVTALELDDARLEIKKLQADAEDLNKKVNRLKETKSPGDWENRVNAMVGQVGEIKKASDPLVAEAEALDVEVNKTFRALTEAGASELSSPEEIALVRAQAVYFGVKGGDQATKLSERYKVLLKGADDGWAAVAFAEYAANARVQPEVVVKARAAVDELRAKDSTFLRPYVLSGRLALIAKQYDAAVSVLDEVALLNPKLELAGKLAGWAKAEAAEAAKPKSDPAPAPAPGAPPP